MNKNKKIVFYQRRYNNLSVGIQKSKTHENNILYKKNNYKINKKTVHNIFTKDKKNLKKKINFSKINFKIKYKFSKILKKNLRLLNNEDLSNIDIQPYIFQRTNFFNDNVYTNILKNKTQFINIIFNIEGQHLFMIYEKFIKVITKFFYNHTNDIINKLSRYLKLFLYEDFKYVGGSLFSYKLWDNHIFEINYLGEMECYLFKQKKNNENKLYWVYKKLNNGHTPENQDEFLRLGYDYIIDYIKPDEDDYNNYKRLYYNKSKKSSIKYTNCFGHFKFLNSGLRNESNKRITLLDNNTNYFMLVGSFLFWRIISIELMVSILNNKNINLIYNKNYWNNFFLYEYKNYNSKEKYDYRFYFNYIFFKTNL